MKNKFFAVLFVLPAILLAAEKSESTVVLSMVSGAVRVKASDSAKWVKAVVNAQLASEAVIQTGAKARVRVRFLDDQSEIIIPEGKTVVVANLLKKRTELRADANKMKLNRIKARLSRQANPNEVSATAVAGVRGADVSKTTQAKQPEEFIWEE